MRYLGIWQEARDFSGRSLAKKKLTPLVLSTLGVKGQKILRIVPDFDHHLTTTEIFSNAQIRISIPVHFAFLIAISDIRKPPKEPFLWRFWCARLDSNQRPSGSEFLDTQRKTTISSRFSSVVHKVQNHIKSPQSLFRTGFAGFCMRGGQEAVKVDDATGERDSLDKKRAAFQVSAA